MLSELVPDFSYGILFSVPYHKNPDSIAKARFLFVNSMSGQVHENDFINALTTC